MLFDTFNHVSSLISCKFVEFNVSVVWVTWVEGVYVDKSIDSAMSVSSAGNMPVAAAATDGFLNTLNPGGPGR